MSTFLINVYPDYGFCEEKLKEQGGYWSFFEEELNTRVEAKAVFCRFTQGTFTVTSIDKKSCKEAVLEAWKSVYPGESLPELIITDFEFDEDKNEVLRRVHTALYGARDYQRLVSDIANASARLEKRNAKKILLSQNYLFSVDKGCGFSTLISSLGHFLLTFGLFETENEEQKKYYKEFTVTHDTDAEGGGTEPDDIIDFLDNNAEEKKFNIIGIDVSYYLNSNKKNDLREFIGRLERFYGDYIFAFRIPYLEKRVSDEITDLFSDLMLLRSVKIPPLHESVVLETIWDTANATEYILDPDLTDVFLERIREEKSDGRFYGFKTAVKIGREAVLEKIMEEERIACAFDHMEEIKMLPGDLKGLTGKKKEKTGYDALEDLIGMEKITERIREIVASVKVALSNEKLERPCIHMRFTGAPGTGKTTVARIIGQIMKEEGILRKGGFFEFSGRDLVAEYVGQTSVKTAGICRDAYGSVLFIDEAYSLYDGENSNNDYGREAITTLVAEMENHRDDMLVVMAGYTDEMDNLMKANIGLRSRMPLIIDFPNYTKEQLFEIFMSMVKKHFEYEPELETSAKEYFMNLDEGYMQSREFSNARFVRNLYERTWSKAALRSGLSGKSETVLTATDFKLASEEKEFSEKIESKKRIGF